MAYDLDPRMAALMLRHNAEQNQVAEVFYRENPDLYPDADAPITEADQERISAVFSPIFERHTAERAALAQEIRVENAGRAAQRLRAHADRE